ncbi:rhomboid family intramembrane serine protease [Fodinibius sediminis]|uniref:Membrane associated serine protease, rhomboid family n=1 Tax=Fodinibius sediminis TaxID=1214077 RepID=A0A521DAN9_9BACT|nr:rhomboid family intramembrane serine protease [Fodinibius sediminis]SMO68705.1 Membrane associated serine protease, rhomboid family [Fodinibius sediminis]
MYENESFSSSFKRGYRGLPVAIRTLITLNVAVFVLQVVLGIFGRGYSSALIQAFAFYPEWQTALFQPWRLVTYMFLHGGAFHLLFNMLWLWWMGRAVEERLGPRTFTVIYMGAGIGGALLDILFAQIMGFNFVIGASGAVYGIMVAFAMLFPTMPIMLILLPPIQARYVVAGLIALDVLLLGSQDGTARIVHLGGAGIGYLLMRAQIQGTDLSKWMLPVEQFWYRLKGTYQKSKSKPKNKNMYTVSDVEIVDETEQSELDQILEKISEKGYDGLTQEEKKKLFELSKKN